MAMTAWAAKLLTNSICLSVKWPNFLAIDHDGADQLVVLEHGHVDYRSCAPKLGRYAGHGISRSVDFPYNLPVRLRAAPMAPAGMLRDMAARWNVPTRESAEAIYLAHVGPRPPRVHGQDRFFMPCGLAAAGVLGWVGRGDGHDRGGLASSDRIALMHSA